MAGKEKKMKLQTVIPLKPEENQIDYTSEILLLGSCFSENIGGKLDYYKFQNVQNPFGVIFNPVSIAKLINRAISADYYSDADIFQHQGIWKCFEVHSGLNALEPEQFLENLNEALDNLRQAIFGATHIIFTYGTSWVYKNVDNLEVVANCHKLSQDNFKKELLSIETISESLGFTFDKISEVNPLVTIINTVSPVRHIKDGYTENSLSKAHLLSAIHQVIRVYTNARMYYFPSFEIMMDELRDYRFYAEDMLHPNKTGIDIIWEKFNDAWVSPETKLLQKEIASIQNALLHKPFKPESAEHLRFLNSLQNKISFLTNKFPHIHF